MAELTVAPCTPVANEGRPAAPEAGRAAARARLFDLPVALVENVRGGGPRGQTSDERFSPQFQLTLPHRGIFVWHVAGEEVVGDANQVLFVTGGEPYRLSQPVNGGFEELVITPGVEVLAEIAGVDEGRLAAHAWFRRRRRAASARLQSFRARFLHWACHGLEVDDLAAEERVIAILSDALDASAPRGLPAGSKTARSIRRAKEFLEAHMASPIRLSDVGRAAGASPAYLTNMFGRVEGMSLHQYLNRLRLARALVELPHADDLTTLAFDTGFSSHSHFTAAFRRAYGLTPSEFRRIARSQQPPAL